jgi:DNA replication protein DnaC
VVDELGSLPLGCDEANLFFNVATKRYKQFSIILASNLALTKWASAPADNQALTAVLFDRLLHHAHIVQTSEGELSIEGKTQSRSHQKVRAGISDLGAGYGGSRSTGR